MAQNEEGDLSTQQPADIELKHPNTSCNSKEATDANVCKEEALNAEAKACPAAECSSGEPSKRGPEEAEAPRKKKKRKKQSYKDLMSSLKV